MQEVLYVLLNLSHIDPPPPRPHQHNNHSTALSRSLCKVPGTSSVFHKYKDEWTNNLPTAVCLHVCSPAAHLSARCLPCDSSQAQFNLFKVLHGTSLLTGSDPNYLAWSTRPFMIQHLQLVPFPLWHLTESPMCRYTTAHPQTQSNRIE